MADNQKKWLAVAAGLSLLVLGFFGLGQYFGQRSASTAMVSSAGLAATDMSPDSADLTNILNSFQQFLRASQTYAPRNAGDNLSPTTQPAAPGGKCGDASCWEAWRRYDALFVQFLNDMRDWRNYVEDLNQYWKDLAAWQEAAKKCSIGSGIATGIVGIFVPGFGLVDVARQCLATPPPTPPTPLTRPFPGLPPTPPSCRRPPPSPGLPLCEDEGDTGTVGPGPM